MRRMQTNQGLEDSRNNTDMSSLGFLLTRYILDLKVMKLVSWKCQHVWTKKKKKSPTKACSLFKGQQSSPATQKTFRQYHTPPAKHHREIVAPPSPPPTVIKAKWGAGFPPLRGCKEVPHTTAWVVTNELQCRVGTCTIVKK